MSKMKWKRVALGSVLALAWAIGCSDDGGSSSGGTGGTDSTGGTDGGTGGKKQTTGGTDGGMAGSGAAGDSGVSVECADGCAVLSAPLTDAKQSARWQIYLSPTDLRDEVLTFRVYVKSGSAGGFQYGFQNGEDLGWAGVYPWANLADLAGTWTELEIDLSQYAPEQTGEGGAGGAGGASGSEGPDSSQVQTLNLWIESGDGPGPWENPSVVYVDYVKSSGGTIDYEFETGVDDLNFSTGAADGGTSVEGTATHTTVDP